MLCALHCTARRTAKNAYRQCSSAFMPGKYTEIRTRSIWQNKICNLPAVQLYVVSWVGSLTNRSWGGWSVSVARSVPILFIGASVPRDGRRMAFARASSCSWLVAARRPAGLLRPQASAKKGGKNQHQGFGLCCHW